MTLDRDARMLERRARKRAQSAERRRARRYVTPRKCPGAQDQFDLNPHNMHGPLYLPRPTAHDRALLNAAENTREYGPTIEYVACMRGCAPGTKCHHGRTRIRVQVSEEFRRKWDGTIDPDWVAPVREGENNGLRLDPVTAPERERAWLSWTDMLQHGLVVERE